MIPDILCNIKVLVLDVDGVLTDGGIIYNDRGAETKVFNVKDGLGIRLLMESGIRVCIVTGRRSEALLHRCRNLGISDIFDGVGDKAAVLNEIIEKTGVELEQVAAVGDDLPDLPLMRRVGVAVAVADAVEPVRRAAHMVTEADGGNGAVREVCEAILKAQKRWDPILKGFTA
jgi:3-deoxy-D-manno-octulosonate 8-phosphate phosphatase (KDO 8-P phosphatase)